MGMLGISIVLASVVYFCLRPPAWLLHSRLFPFLGRGRPGIASSASRSPTRPQDLELRPPPPRPPPGRPMEAGGDGPAAGGASKAALDRVAMPPPALPRSGMSDRRPNTKITAVRATASASRGEVVTRGRKPGQKQDEDEDEAEQTTPKAAGTATARVDSVPTFSLSGTSSDDLDEIREPALIVHAAPRGRSEFAGLPRSPPGTTAGFMAPPPRPTASSVSSLGPPRLPLARTNAPTPVLPLPNRGPPGAATPSTAPNGLAPPPTHSAKPSKPSRKVILTPGHSPLDWARVSGSGASDLRNLAAGTPYLRVTPAMLRHQNGRKGRDAWTALAGRVYNIQPYVPFHPGGGPELLRAAGRDGSRLFGEIHPWVNYETMLAACLVGVLVDEDEGDGRGGRGQGQVCRMDEMD